ncbi:MAG: L-rhamnose mutarotase [Bacteroidales bacterium]|nr:L-rhamnose mutarotase [Bacteroidales bacterium]
MERIMQTVSALLVSVLIVIASAACTSVKADRNEIKEVKRVGMVIKIKPEYIEEYKEIHSDSNSGVRDLLTAANMHNFSIFLTQLDDGNWYEFGYYEYTGDDFDADMAKLDKHPRNIEWLEICDPMQVPLEGYDGWKEMEQVYYNK